MPRKCATPLALASSSVGAWPFVATPGMVMTSRIDQNHRKLRWRRGRAVLIDAADDLAIGDDIEVFVLPLAGRTRGAGALEYEPVHSSLRALSAIFDEVRKAECRELRPIRMALNLRPNIGHGHLQDHVHQLTEKVCDVARHLDDDVV